MLKYIGILKIAKKSNNKMEGEVSPNRKNLLLIDNLDSAISTIEQWETEEGFKECVRDRYIKNNPKLENIRIELESHLDV